MNSHELFVQNKFKLVTKFIPKNSKILDIGCGDGTISDFLKEVEYYGVDGDESLVRISNQKGLKVKNIDLNKDEIPFKKEKFDYILLLDILEHVVNPSRILNNAKDRLNKKGKLIITLPNDYHLLNKIRFVFNKHLTEDPFSPYGHLHYFPINSGEKFLIKNKFKTLNKINLAPVKPVFIPQFIKNLLSKFFPQSFSRDVLYIISPN